VITGAEAVEHAASHATELREAGVQFLVIEDNTLAPISILKALAAEGITRALIEAGPRLSTAFVAAGLVDTLHWYRAPILLGNAGKPAIDALDSTLETTQRHRIAHTRMLGGDCYERIELR
jgi:diaminohydroxyphosphoribosylaminopyrimidine deaminase/5-amino-6-(5-phosphoribosylamino)uracil reductase